MVWAERTREADKAISVFKKPSPPIAVIGKLTIYAFIPTLE
jgi:hypothetical protein